MYVYVYIYIYMYTYTQFPLTTLAQGILIWFKRIRAAIDDFPSPSTCPGLNNLAAKLVYQIQPSPPTCPDLPSLAPKPE